MPRPRYWIALALALTLVSTQLRAETLELSSDTAISLRGVFVAPNAPAKDTGAAVIVAPLGPSAPGISLPNGANLDGFDRLPNGDVLFSSDVPVAVPGLASPGVAEPGDVVRVTPGGPVLAFSAAAAGLPAGVNVDAVGAEQNGDLLLSFDTTQTLGGRTLEDCDVVRIDPATFAASRVYDCRSQGVASGLDLDGVYRKLENGHLLLAFDGSGTLGGVTFGARDVLDFDPASSVYALVYDGAALGWPSGAKVDDVSGFPLDSDGDGPPDFADNCRYVTNPSQSDVGGVGPGSVPDGIGDACQCGEVNDDGRVLALDLAALRAGLTGSTAGITAAQRCNAIGPVDATVLSTGMRADCNVVDVAVVSRALAGQKPGIGQVCQSALP